MSMTSTTQPISATVLRLRGIAVAAAGRTLLRGIDLSLAAGERVALRGPSGSGKTTLLRTINGLIDPTAGEVELDGNCPGDLLYPCYRRRTILVGQRPVLLAGTVRANLQRPFQFKTTTEVFPASRATELLMQLGLNDQLLDQEARSLSEGEQQRVCLARALLLAPQVLLLDEPTSALDEEAVDAVERIVTAETDRRGLAALIVTHNREQSERWCHRSFPLDPHLVDAKEST
jgi:ABC-type iron transport system FetAB ATPase subunit